jgi:TonB family protein
MANATKFLKIFIAIAGLMPLFGGLAHAAALKIIANPSVRAEVVSASEIRGVFWAERNSLRDGSHVEPVFERAGTAHETFLKEFLKESSEALQIHYESLVFTGKSAMPKSFNSDAEVVAYVARTRGTIGYVGVLASTDGVKVLDVVPEGSRSERPLLTRVEPEYPETLRQMHIGGVVRLQVIISPQGSVEAVTLLGGNPILGDAAVKAVRRWVYAARPSRTTIEVSVPFDGSR